MKTLLSLIYVALVLFAFDVVGSNPGILMSIEPLSLFAIGSGVAKGFSGLGSGRRTRNNTGKMVGRANEFADKAIDKDFARFSPELSKFGRYETSFNTLAKGYGKEAEKAYLDTAEGRSFKTELAKNAEKNKNQWLNANNLSGGSVESLLAGMSNINEAEASGLSGLVAGSDQRRMALRHGQLSSLSQAMGAHSAKTGVKQNLLNNARGFASSLYTNANNAAANQSAAQSNALSQGFGQLTNTLTGLIGAGG